MAKYPTPQCDDTCRVDWTKKAALGEFGWCFTHRWNTKKCVECGMPFHCVYQNSKTCSAKCRKRLSRKNHPDRSVTR